MASEIFRNIIEQQIDVFAGTFGDTASNIFTQNSKLIHPLEYGMYKERCARELLLYTTNKNIGISDGFIITANNHVSTQCDIIMYQNNTLPVIDNGITNFYPIEIVKGIGEVKSTLNITKFKEALIKLSKNKKMFLDRKGTMKGEKKRSGEFDEIFTFLICNKLDFDISKVNFDDIYADESDIRMRHNLILSMQDGIFVYRMQVTKFPPKQKARYLGNGGKLDAVPILWPYPHHTEIDETYTHWAKMFNVKQMAQTILYLQEHEFESFEQLDAATNEVIKRFHEVSAELKYLEKQLGDSKEIKKQIINYSKTRDIYVEYRKAGYSKKFFEAHREEIQTHKMAKESFDKLGVSKIPRVKELNQRISESYDKRKNIMEEYYQLKEEMRKMVVVRENVKRIFKENVKAKEYIAEKQ